MLEKEADGTDTSTSERVEAPACGPLKVGSTWSPSVAFLSFVVYVSGIDVVA